MITLFMSGALVLLVGAVTGALLTLVAVKVMQEANFTPMDDSEWEEWEEEEEL